MFSSEIRFSSGKEKETFHAFMLILQVTSGLLFANVYWLAASITFHRTLQIISSYTRLRVYRCIKLVKRQTLCPWLLKWPAIQPASGQGTENSRDDQSQSESARPATWSLFCFCTRFPRNEALFCRRSSAVGCIWRIRRAGVLQPWFQTQGRCRLCSWSFETESVRRADRKARVHRKKKELLLTLLGPR